MSEVGSLQIGSEKRRVVQVTIVKCGATEVGLAEVGLLDRAITKNRLFHLLSHERSVIQIAALKSHGEQKITAMRKVHAHQLRVFKLGMLKASIFQISRAEIA